MSITAAQTETSVNLKFMAFVLSDQNELHIWQVGTSQPRCLARISPADLLATPAENARFTAICFSSTHDEKLVIGLSTGHLALYDCAQAKQVKTAAQLCETAVTAIGAKNGDANWVVATQAKLQLVSAQLKVVDHLETYSRKKNLTAVKLAVGGSAGASPEDASSVVQVDKKNQIRLGSEWKQANVHQNGVKDVCFLAEDAKHIVTCSDDEAAIWSTKHDQPVMLLDEPSSDHTLQLISSTKLRNKTLIACLSSAEISLYTYEKGQTETVKTCDSRMSLGLDARNQNVQGQILACKLEADQQQKSGSGKKQKDSAVMLTIIFGNLYKLERKRINMGTLTKLRSQVNLAKENALATKGTATGTEESKAAGNDYHVARLDQENVPMTAVTAQNLRLLPSDASLDNIESRMTSVSLGTSQKRKNAVAQPGASLTNVLRQALQSDDTDQLDWVITQKDPAMVEATLNSLQEKEAIAAFFRLVLAKFQQEKSVSDQLAVLLWLKTLLRVHWALVVQVASAQDLATLSQIQTFIQRKTASMDKLLLLKGKLEMAKRTIQLQKSSGKKQTSAMVTDDVADQSKGGKKKPLVYKDAPDGDSSQEEDAVNANSDGDQQSDDDDEDMSSDGAGNSDSEEEIKEIPLKKLAKKNMKRAKYSDQIDGEDESSSDDDGDRYEKPAQKQAGQNEAQAGEDDESDDYDENDSEQARRQMDKLADSGTDDDEMEIDEDESEDDGADIMQ